MLASLGAVAAPGEPREVELWRASQEVTSARLRGEAAADRGEEVTSSMREGDKLKGL